YRGPLRRPRVRVEEAQQGIEHRYDVAGAVVAGPREGSRRAWYEREVDRHPARRRPPPRWECPVRRQPSRIIHVGRTHVREASQTPGEPSGWLEVTATRNAATSPTPSS